MKIIFWLIFASILIYATFFTEKDRLDREVKRLCAIDGGVKVYETVRLPAEKFDQYEQVLIPFKENIKPMDEYYYDSSTVHLIKGNPELRKYHSKIYRRSDEKLLGESINYSRVGGDIPGPWQPSSHMCPENEGFNNLMQQIFIRSQGGGRK
ncbi:hypothetical protein [Nitrosomonas sp.]|uniref:hypothetical protein n=1 Tax=Nitrosomonas sp. TaxID=42353 RepID=UPI001DE816E9|nr:hypothetical protein [Nitrosomonas sp.]MBX3616804.1 hypothetical protein [Nitrosomonas sp.]